MCDRYLKNANAATVHNTNIDIPIYKKMSVFWCIKCIHFSAQFTICSTLI